ncbi:CbiX/SirB N-terminal domain-containing protein [Streptomyces avicenniae]|uniref:CbiX/SirB N-terminal domain-containing protein n=1 Tax=Streptomyces avicenniae TaxID=500153 RepID=UPI00069A8808|nr:CbiX/SirB N-terminal domain-containing protein [Streptomyces avicenniae]
MSPSDPPALLVVHEGPLNDEGTAALRAFVGALPDRPGAAGVPVVAPGADAPADAVTVALDGAAVAPELLHALERRIGDVLKLAERADTTVLLAAPGSPDPEANAAVHRTARLLWEGSGLAGVEVAFASVAAPDVPSGLDRCVALGARRIVVLPLAVLPGGPADRARAQAEGWAAARTGTEVRHADVVGPVDELADLVLARYRAALDADRCDACGHRVGTAAAR